MIMSSPLPLHTHTPEGLQKQVEKALEYARKWRVADVKQCAVVVCNEDKLKPVTFKWTWVEYELPIVDQCTYVGVELSKDCSWYARIAKVIGKGKSTRRQDGCDPSRLNLALRLKGAF